MLVYSLRRLLSALPTLGLLAMLTFGLIRVAPGGPFDTDHVWPPEVQENILRHFELDRPVSTQFFHWVGALLQGNLGESFQYPGREVTDMISQAMPASLVLGGAALLLALAGGLLLGGLSAWKRGTLWDTSAAFLAIAGVSLPSYFVASLLVLMFSLWLHWLPPALWDGPASAILPILTLAARPLGIVARLARQSMLEALGADYIRTARSKGLGERSVVFRHALRNSLIPVIAFAGPLAANLVTGSFLVETVFQVPGLGRHFVSGILNRDYPLVMGVTMTYGAILILCNLAADLATGLADPRIRVGGTLGET